MSTDKDEPKAFARADTLPSGWEMIEHVPLPAILVRAVDGELVLQSANAQARLQNPGLATVIGQSMTRLYRDQPQVVDDAWRCLRERLTFARDLSLRRFDLTEVTQQLRLTFAFVKPAHVLVCVQSLSTPLTAESALLESESRYRSLVSSLPDAVLLRSAQGRVLACNEMAVQLFGAKDHGSLIGTEHVLAEGYQVLTESGEPVATAEFPSCRVLRTGKPELGQLYALSAPSKMQWIRVSAQPIVSAAGAITGSVTIFTDITEQVNAQRALEESVARLDLALDAAHMGLWEWTPTTDTGWWSPNLSLLFHLEPGNELGIGAFLRQVHPDDHAMVQANAGELVNANEGSIVQYEHRVVGTDQVTRWARIRGRVSKRAGLVHLTGVIMDVTEHRRLEEELRRAHRLESIGRLAGGVAHDFNNLLAAMMGSVEFLADECPPQAHEDLVTLRHGLERARDLTRQLLAFARKQPLEFREVDLGHLVSTVERMLRRLVGPAVEICISDSEPVVVRADPSLIEQVLVNLVVNARDAMATGGLLKIRVGSCTDAKTGELAMLEVADSGAGMSDEVRHKIFDPFFTTKSQGTGLGLASSYGIVKQHGGDIVVDTELGRGTRFRVLLPRVYVASATAAAVSKARADSGGAGCVLVVDDEELVRNTAVRMLKRLGYEVLQAGDARQALAIADQYSGDIDFLLCDIAMPGQSGPAVAAELCRKRVGLKVLFASGYAQGGEYSVPEGAAFLQKPYGRDQLAAKLAELAKAI